MDMSYLYYRYYQLKVIQLCFLKVNIKEKTKNKKKKTGTYFAIITLLSEENANESNMNS